MRDVFKLKLIPALTGLLLVITIAMPTLFNTNLMPAAAAASTAMNVAKVGELDCNGFSKVQQPIKADMSCADLLGASGTRGEDNGHYIGHDEPSVQFLSNAAGSGNNAEWQITLPKERPLPATQTFENMITFWFSMALCDSNSYPQQPCIPDSDKNSGAQAATAAGSAFMELQLYPPGFSPFINQISCDLTHWCAAMTIDSLECNFNFVTCNANCEEPVNFAFLQLNGVPAGRPGPATATNATFTPNKQTFLMNQGDSLKITVKDTRAGLLNKIVDQSNGKSGFMVASANNGFENTNLTTCAGTPFAFHPEYSTAKLGNDIPWAALQANVGVSMEIGHFEAPDGDSDDAPCFTGPTLPGCLGADLDFDGTSYVPDWPDGTKAHATPLTLSSVSHNGFGPLSAPNGSNNYQKGYPTFQIESEIPDSETGCTSTTLSGCVIPPTGAAFYPFYAQSGRGAACRFTYGNDIRGQTVNDFGRDQEYGTPYLAWFFADDSSGVEQNPCTPHAL
jgi:hypothetical protein